MMAKTLTRRGLIGGTVATAGLLGVTAAANVAANMFGSAIDSKLGRGEMTVTKMEGTEDWDAQYYKPQYASLAEAKAASDVVSEQVTDEGIVLLKNNGILPLAPGAEVTPFGWAYENAAYSGTGAASSTDTTMITCADAIASKLSVNTAALDAAAGTEPSYPDAAPGSEPLDFDTNSLQSQQDAGESAKIYEFDPSVYEGVSGCEGACGVVVIRRGGSEGIDKRFYGYADGTPHYLALTESERGVIRAAKRACGKVVVVLNSANPMELAPIMAGELEADAILWVGTAGSRGFASLAKILVGEVNPSGRLTDIYPTDFTADPTYKNFGRFDYTNSEVNVMDLASLFGGGEASVTTQSRHFVEYQEGVYVGYRYYETAALTDPSFTYGELDGAGAVAQAGSVAYPFGYGLSYTTFEQAISSFDDAGDDIVLTVHVTNTGDVAGKEVVQAYFSAPYTDYGWREARVGCVRSPCQKPSGSRVSPGDMRLPDGLLRAVLAGTYASVPRPSGTRSIMKKPTTNSTAMESTPKLELPVSAVNVPTKNVPRMAAYLPKMSKKPKYSLARSLGQSLPNSLRESAWMPPWNMPTRIARNQNSTAERRKNAAKSVMPK